MKILIHFIYPVTKLTRPWSIINTLAMTLARKYHPDADIWLWTNAPDQVPSVEAEIRKVDLPTHLGGIEIVWPQYVSDVMRLQILYNHGGVYMDTDMLLRMDLNDHIKGAYNHERLWLSWEDADRTSICNALMISPPGNAFVKAWLEKMPEALQSHTWAQGGVVLPAQLAKDETLKNSVAVLHHTFACPLSLSHQWLFDPKLKSEAKHRINGATAIHVFETFWRDVIQHITPDWCEQNDCLFSEIWFDA